MDSIERHDIVRSTAGHDRGNIFLVTEIRGDRVFLVDGKRRKLRKPKLKSVKHVELVFGGTHQLAESIGSTMISDKEILKLLAGHRCTPGN